MRDFLSGVLGAYEQRGERELSTPKLADYLTARYGTLADARAKLGDMQLIRASYFGVQRGLYRD
jgi:type I restriction enzyme R subunit